MIVTAKRLKLAAFHKNYAALGETRALPGQMKQKGSLRLK
jgi:hypothetical protein